MQATPAFAYCHGEMSNTLSWGDICIIFQRTNTTVACLATPRVNTCQPYPYMTWHQHTLQSFHDKHDTRRTNKAGMWQQFTGCKKQNSLLLLFSLYYRCTNNWLHKVGSFEQSSVNLQVFKAHANGSRKCLNVWTHYCAQSMSWYSLDLSKHAFTPSSSHSFFAWSKNSWGKERQRWRSRWQQYRTSKVLNKPGV